MTTAIIKYGELRNGDHVWVQGHLLEVSNLHEYADAETKRTLVRFTGKCINHDDPIRGTDYDGGTYGAYTDAPATIETRTPKYKAVRIPGHGLTLMSVCGQTQLLLDLLHQAGRLPECHIYSYTNPKLEEVYKIDGIFAGNTLEEVTTSVWQMVSSYAENGSLTTG